MAAPEPEFQVDLAELAQFLGDRKALNLASVLDWMKLAADESSSLFARPSPYTSSV